MNKKLTNHSEKITICIWCPEAKITTKVLCELGFIVKHSICRPCWQEYFPWISTPKSDAFSHVHSFSKSFFTNTDPKDLQKTDAQAFQAHNK